MAEIKFGTDGWRAIIADDYTIENVKRVAEATAKWLLNKNSRKIVIGYDCRFGGRMFSECTAKVMGHFGIKSLISTDFVTTPMVSLATIKTGSSAGVVITASHNPPSYNGYKLKSAEGGPMIPKQIEEVEQLIPEKAINVLPTITELKDKGLIEYVDMEDMYLMHVYKSFDMEAINESGIRIAYDAMYGAGQSVAKKIFKNATFLHCEFNPSFLGQAPEPIHRNLGELSEKMSKNEDLRMGLANDGDADRIGLYDENGKFVDSHHILLLLLYYMKAYKGMDGKVIVTFSVTDKMEKLAKHFDLEIEVTKIGFKYIAEIMLNEDVLVGGEESGGLAVKGHIPERDGIWIGLVILEFMAKTGKSLKQLIQEVYQLVGSFHCDRDDLHISQELKESVVEKCSNAHYSNFGKYEVQKIEKIDGFKFWLADSQWVMIRPSGTEPVLRVYAQDVDKAATRALLDTVGQVILN
ncbi:MAG: phosphoglucomutase/phosphomannomutase family protein [Bacteroidia bacterium]|nr:phosphoglucomutase/phosphomannomutase family protein [Bacteroidia bacterium]